MLTPGQVHIILELLDRQILFFAGRSLGPHILSDQDKQLLASYRVDYNHSYLVDKDPVVKNFYLGILSNILSDKEVKELTSEQLINYIQSGQHIPLNAVERATIDSIKMQALSDIKTYRGRIFQDINNVVGNTFSDTKANQQEFIREQILEGTAKRESRKEIARNIARLTGDWNRNFTKSVQYISHTAFNEGRAAMIERRYESNTKAKVYFQVQPDACEHCIKHYLTKGAGSEPKIFTLQDLQSNGTNIGKKVADWKATLGALHVHCRCLVTEYVPGMEWNGNRFVYPKGEHQAVNRPKVHIVFNGKDYYV